MRLLKQAYNSSNRSVTLYFDQGQYIVFVSGAVGHRLAGQYRDRDDAEAQFASEVE